MVRWTALASALIALSLGGNGLRAGAATDPAQNLARIRLIVVATAATTDITVDRKSVV